MGAVVPLRREFADLEPWRSKRWIAEHFAVCGSTVDNWTRLGMPYRQVGGRRKFRLSACEQWHTEHFAV